MSKVLAGTCAAGIVKIDGLPVTATILSEGVKSSTGVVLLDEDKATYVTSNAKDIKDLITNIGNVIDQIVIALTSLDAVTVTPGSSAAAITLINTLKTTLATQGSNLK